MLCTPGGAITLGTCGSKGTATLIVWRLSLPSVTGSAFNRNALTVRKRLEDACAQLDKSIEVLRSESLH